MLLPVIHCSGVSGAEWKFLEKGVVTPKEQAEPQLLLPSCFFSKRDPLTRGMEHLQLHMD
jgi:hypothetical protein